MLSIESVLLPVEVAWLAAEVIGIAAVDWCLVPEVVVLGVLVGVWLLLSSSVDGCLGCVLSGARQVTLAAEAATGPADADRLLKRGVVARDAGLAEVGFAWIVVEQGGALD